MILLILQYIACILTIAVGALSLFAPEKAAGFTGLAPQGGRGITEIRAVLGGLFIALGVVPFFFGDVAYTVVGISYLVIAVVRLVSIFLDRSSTQSNWISLASEIILGIVLVL